MSKKDKEKIENEELMPEEEMQLEKFKKESKDYEENVQPPEMTEEEEIFALLDTGSVRGLRLSEVDSACHSLEFIAHLRETGHYKWVFKKLCRIPKFRQKLADLEPWEGVCKFFGFSRTTIELRLKAREEFFEQNRQLIAFSGVRYTDIRTAFMLPGELRTDVKKKIDSGEIMTADDFHEVVTTLAEKMERMEREIKDLEEENKFMQIEVEKSRIPKKKLAALEEQRKLLSAENAHLREGNRSKSETFALDQIHEFKKRLQEAFGYISGLEFDKETDEGFEALPELNAAIAYAEEQARGMTEKWFGDRG